MVLRCGQVCKRQQQDGWGNRCKWSDLRSGHWSCSFLAKVRNAVWPACKGQLPGLGGVRSEPPAVTIPGASFLHGHKPQTLVSDSDGTERQVSQETPTAPAGAVWQLVSWPKMLRWALSLRSLPSPQTLHVEVRFRVYPICKINHVYCRKSGKYGQM